MSNVKKEWFFDRMCGVQVAAYAEDGALVEASVESREEGSILGNIYKGRVSNIVAGMQAAFISCGLEKNCYLPLVEGAERFPSYDGSGKERYHSLKAGDEILVQVVKLPRGSKGAKVTCDLSFVGKTLIYLPETDFLGISRKITDQDKRAELLKTADSLRGAGQGYIVRTAAESAAVKQMKSESEYLKKMSASVFEAAKTASVGDVVYREAELPFKVMRDSLGGDADKIYVGDKELYENVVRLVRMRSDFSERKVVHYTGARSMFDEFGLSEQIYRLAEPVVPLPSGGDIVIDRTEAMTVVDVNTGKYVGESNLEETVFGTNLEAAREIARQVRLRNIGGIVVVDFIDMDDAAHCAAVEKELVSSLMTDRAKCRVLPMSELCLCTFTRKRTINPISEFLLKACPHCTREGYVLSDRYMAIRIRNEILSKFADGYRAVIIELNRSLLNKILSCGYYSADLAGDWKNKRVYFVPHSTWHEEKFTIRGDNAQVLTLPDDAQILY